MRPSGLLSLLVLGSSLALRAQVSAPAPIPSAILNAKAVFVSNGGSDSGMFPEPFSGDPNRPYSSFYSQLKTAGRFQIVDDPAQADIVMQIQLVSPSGPQNSSKSLGAADPLPYFRLVIFDRKSQFILWTITEPIELALLQKTHDRNFDEAMQRIAGDLEALLSPNPSQLYPDPSGNRPRSKHGSLVH